MATGNEALVPALLLVGALVMPVTFVTFLAGRPLTLTVGTSLVAVTALAGGVVGVVLAGLVEFETLNSLGLGDKVGVAVIEETAKLIVPASLLLWKRSRCVGDGLILGAASGAGFAALETMGYAFTTIVTRHGDLTEVSNLLLVRGLWSPAGHMAWTGITAAALYYAVRTEILGPVMLDSGRGVRGCGRPAHRLGRPADAVGVRGHRRNRVGRPGAVRASTDTPRRSSLAGRPEPADLGRSPVAILPTTAPSRAACQLLGRTGRAWPIGARAHDISAGQVAASDHLGIDKALGQDSSHPPARGRTNRTPEKFRNQERSSP